MALYRQWTNSSVQIIPGPHISNGFYCNFFRKILPNLMCLVRKINMIHNRQHRNGNKHAHYTGKTTAPGSKNPCHFLFQRSTSGAGTVIPSIRSTIENWICISNNKSKDIKITKVFYIKRIQEAFSGNTIHHYRQNFPIPGKRKQNIERNNHKERITNQSLNTISDNDRNTSTR